MSDAVRQFEDVRRGNEYEAVSVEEFMAELEGIQAEICTTRNRVWQAVADGTLSEEYLRRYCKEYYFLGVNYTREFASWWPTHRTRTPSACRSRSTSPTGCRTWPTRRATRVTTTTST